MFLYKFLSFCYLDFFNNLKIGMETIQLQLHVYELKELHTYRNKTGRNASSYVGFFFHENME